MLKRILALLLAIATLAVLASCKPAGGGNATEEPTGTAGDNDKFVGVGANGDPNLRLPKYEFKKNIIRILCHYEITKPDPGLEGPFQTVYKQDWETVLVAPEERVNKFVSMIMGGDAPDIFQYDYFTPALITKGYCQDFDQYIDFTIGLWKDIKPSLDLVSYQGKHYYVGGQQARWENMVWFNKEVFEANGVKTPKEYYDEGNWTWDTFREIAKALTVDADNNGEPEVWGCAIDNLNTFIYPTGLDFVTYNPDGTATNNIKSAPIARGVQFFTDLCIKDKVVYLGNDVREIFPQGKIAMACSPMWYRFTWVDMLRNDTLGFVPPPKDPQADKYYIFESVGGLFMGKDCANPEGAAAYANVQRYVVLDQNGGLSPEKAEEAYQKSLAESGWTREHENLYKEMFNDPSKAPVLSTWVTFEINKYWGDIWFRPRQGEPWATIAEELAPKIDEDIARILQG